MHDHTHNTNQSSKRIGWAFILNVSFTLIEFVGGILTNSTAIMADAVHDLGDSLSIGSAWVLNRMAQRGADSSFTYGYKRFSLLGALINGLVLIAGSVWVLAQAIIKTPKWSSSPTKVMATMPILTAKKKLVKS